jgi:hypothetical protein
MAAYDSMQAGFGSGIVRVRGDAPGLRSPTMPLKFIRMMTTKGGFSRPTQTGKPYDSCWHHPQTSPS